MTDSREKKMEKLLEELRSESPGIEAAVLISSDAMPLASDTNGQLEEEILSAMASALVAAGERVARDLIRGDIDYLYMRGGEGDLVVVKVDDEIFLACTVNHESKMGLTLLDVNRCAKEVAEVL